MDFGWEIKELVYPYALIRGLVFYVECKEMNRSGGHNMLHDAGIWKWLNVTHLQQEHASLLLYHEVLRVQ